MSTGWDKSAAIEAVFRMMEEHDPDTADHMWRVGELSAQIGGELGLGEAEVELLRRGGLLHDIGKLAVSSAPRASTPSLSSLEAHRIARHPVVGGHIVRLLVGAEALAPLVQHHQERLDGSGYPGGLVGAEIPLLARVVAVADAFDSLVAPRSYQALLHPREAVEQLREGAGRLWDAEVVGALARCVGAEPLAERAVGGLLAA